MSTKSIPFPEPDPASAFSRPLRQTEAIVSWLRHSSRPEAAAARQRVNAWYAGFPDHDDRLIARLRSEIDEDLYSALDELYVYQRLCQVETDVRYEEGGAGEPDFRMYRAGEQVLVVEVVSLFQNRDWTKEARRHGELADYLNDHIRPQRYFLHVEILEQQGNVPLSQLRSFAGKWLDTLPAPSVTTASYQNGASLPSRDFRRSGIHVRLQALPMKPHAASYSDPDARVVGLGPVIGGLVDSHSRLKEKLEVKRKKRYALDSSVPFVVAVGNHDTFCTDFQLMLAIYGHGWEHVGGAPPPFPIDPKLRGFFGLGVHGERPHNRRFSAIAAFYGNVLLDPPEEPDWLLFDNPYASVQLPDGLIPATYRFGPQEGSGWRWEPYRQV